MFPHGNPFGNPNNPRFQPPRQVGQNEQSPTSTPTQNPDYFSQHDPLLSYISQMSPPVMQQVPGAFQYGFAPFARMPAQYPLQRPQEPEVVPETQPARRPGKEAAPEPSKPAKRSHKKKPAGEPRAKKSVLPWTSDEEVILARCWCAISEDPEISNFQDRTIFWNRVRDKFLELMDKDDTYRKDDSISGKWSDINTKCQLFHAVYQRIRDKWQSGSSDADIQAKALDEFSRTKGTFQYLSVWNVLKDHPKWEFVPNMMSKPKRSAKRSKTSSSVDPDSQASDARTFDLNISEDDLARDVEEVEPPRPAGKMAARKARQQQQAGSSGSELANEVAQMKLRIDALNDLGQKRLELRQKQQADRSELNEILKDRQMQRDLDRLSAPIDHLNPAARELAEKINQRIREKYGL